MNTPRILALDASTTAAGWCVANGGEYQESGVYRPNENDWWERCWLISLWLDEFITTKMVPDFVVLELATGNKGNMHTNRLLGAVEYVVRIFCAGYSRPLVTVTASQVKATGCHKTALAVASAVAGRAITSGDEADAIGVWLAGWAKIQAGSEA